MLLRIFLESNEVASNFEGGHHAGAFNAAIAAIDRELDLFINQGAG
nr:hypothetical protein [Polynucleobacter sp. AP-Nino-20-G2]